MKRRWREKCNVKIKDACENQIDVIRDNINIYTSRTRYSYYCLTFFTLLLLLHSIFLYFTLLTYLYFNLPRPPSNISFPFFPFYSFHLCIAILFSYFSICTIFQRQKRERRWSLSSISAVLLRFEFKGGRKWATTRFLTRTIYRPYNLRLT